MQFARSAATRLWGRNAGAMRAMASDRENARYLPGIRFPDALEAHDDLWTALDGVQDVVVVVPSHALRETLSRIAPCLGDGARVAYSVKGFEPDSGALPHEVALAALGAGVPTAVLSGPTFAREVAAGQPTAMVVASADRALAEDLAHALHCDYFRAYLSDDVTGVEVGGAVKNVFAIAAGISDALGFGANARAALITRGLSEIARLGVALGGRQETFLGLAGIGDLVLTCTDDQSRNRRFGLALGRGDDPEAAVAAIGQVVEGIAAAAETARLADRHGVDMPIVTQVHRVLAHGVAPRDALAALMARELKPE